MLELGFAIYKRSQAGLEGKFFDFQEKKWWKKGLKRGNLKSIKNEKIVEFANKNSVNRVDLK